MQFYRKIQERKILRGRTNTFAPWFQYWVASPHVAPLYRRLRPLLPIHSNAKELCKFRSEFIIFLTDFKFTQGPIPHKAAPYEEFFSWDSRHHCPIEVGAYGSVRGSVRSSVCRSVGPSAKIVRCCSSQTLQDFYVGAGNYYPTKHPFGNQLWCVGGPWQVLAKERCTAP